MSQLHQLKPHPGATKRRKRVGRGVGTGYGKTSGRGHKGQKARGPGARPGFEGGQMPLIRTMPKRGFSFRSKERYQILNLTSFSRVKTEDVIDRAWLHKHDYIESLRKPVKILGDGEISKPLKLRVDAFSRSAVQKIEKAGGRCERADKG